jgi:hypothetical protein
MFETTPLKTVTAKELFSGATIHVYEAYYTVEVVTHYSDGNTMLDVTPVEIDTFNPLKSSLVPSSREFTIYNY